MEHAKLRRPAAAGVGRLGKGRLWFAALLAIAALLALDLASTAPSRAQTLADPTAPNLVASSLAAPLTPEERCDRARLPADRFTAQEVAAWDALCRTGVANLADADQAGCEATGDAPWPQSRDLSQRFLDTILFDEPFRSARARESLQLLCARFPAPVDFSYREIEPALLIDNSRLEEGLSLFNTRARRLLSFRSGRIRGDVNGDRVQVADNLFLRDGAQVYGRLTLTGARIGGNVEIGGSRFMGGVSIDDATIEGAVFLNNGAVVDGDVRLVGAIVGRSVDLGGVRLAGRFDGDSLRVEGSVFLNLGGQYGGDVVLRAARIGSGVEAGGSTFSGEFSLDRAEVGGALVLRESTFRGRALLISARIGSNALLGGARFEGEFLAEDVRFGGTVFLRTGATFVGPASLRYSEIAGNLDAGGARFEGPLHADGLRVSRSVRFGPAGAALRGASFVGARIEDSLHLGGARLGGPIDLENAAIGGALSLSEDDLAEPVFARDARLSLRNTSVGAIRARPEVWTLETGDPLPSDLVGFAYERESALESSEMASMLSAPAEQLIGWIESQRGPDGAPHDAAYNPQPYEQLQAALIREGRLEKAREIKFARYEHYRLAKTTPELRRYGMLVLKYLAGYGVYPAVALLWFGALVILGFGAGFFSPGLVGRSGTEVFWYSFDNALPLLELSEWTKQVRHEIGWITSLFALQRVFGLVLATALIGAVSLL